MWRDRPDRTFVSNGTESAASTLACWTGVRSYWWGLYVGFDHNTVHRLIDAGSNCDRARSILSLIPGAGPFIGQLTYVYCNALRAYLWTFDNWICRHTCQVATIYWWAMLTPFLNCQ